MESVFSFSLLESKILNYLKRTKKTFLTYEELEHLIKPFKPDDYILISTILYEKEPQKYFLLPNLIQELHDDGRTKEIHRDRTEILGVSRESYRNRKHTSSKDHNKSKAKHFIRYADGTFRK